MTIDHDDRVFFAFVKLVPARAETVLGPGAGGAFTHVAARALDDDSFLDRVRHGAAELGLLLDDVEWLSTAQGLTPVQIRSKYYHDLVDQLQDHPIAWAELKCYPSLDDSTARKQPED
jgi:hypothetical protein